MLNINKMLCLLLIVFATAASAGNKGNYPVTVFLAHPTVAWAQGSIAAAYNSADSNQFIGCMLRVDTSSSTSTSLFCSAVDAAGVSGQCTMYYPPQAVIDMINSLNDTSSLGFQWNKSSGLCTLIQVERSSYQMPRVGSTTALNTSTNSEAPKMMALPGAVQEGR